jgi:hypothetical protein
MSKNQREGSEGLPNGWRWAWDDTWSAVVRCARRDGIHGPVDVYLTDDGEVAYDGCTDAPLAVVRAVIGVKAEP